MASFIDQYLLRDPLANVSDLFSSDEAVNDLFGFEESDEEYFDASADEEHRGADEDETGADEEEDDDQGDGIKEDLLDDLGLLE